MTTTVRPSVRETAILLANPAPRVITDVRFLDLVASDQISNALVVEGSPANVTAVGLHGFVQSGTIMLVAPADKTADLRSFLAAMLQNTRAVMRALSTQRQAGLGATVVPDTIRVVYPGDIVRFGDSLPQGAAFCILNMNNQAGSPTYPNTGVSLADAKFGGSPLVRWFFQDPGPQSRIDFVRTPFRVFNLTPEAAAPSFGNSVGRYISPTARSLALRFISSGLSRLTVESSGYALWWRDLHDGYWMHHPDDDMIAGRRGLIDTTHDVEVFAVPGHADMFAVVNVSGTATPKYSYSVMDADP